MIVYKITNKINGCIYIGQTINTIEKRWKQHLSKRSGCRKLKHAIAKYGGDSFTIEQIDRASNIDELNKKEELWINILNTITPNGYNLIAGGKNRTQSLETRQKRSKAMMGFVRGPQTPEHKEKTAAIKRGVKQLPEIIAKRAKACKKPIIDCTTGLCYDSIRDAAKILGLRPPNISANLAKKSAHCGGRVFKYKDVI
jgi:group I intron endonuclease